MRIVKDPEIRKNEILDAAEELFTLKGFDGTSTNDILERVGIARGTLYYHFKSKEDIMDALIERINARVLSAAKEAASDKSVPVPERLLRTVAALKISEQNTTVMEHIHRPQNALMHQKIQKTMLKSIPPILTEIIRDGIKEGLLNTPFPYECMEMVFTYLNTIFDSDMLEMSDLERSAKIKAFIFNAERLFGAREGSFANVVAMFGE
jgi:AcrR family transcriptional regulator